MGLSIHAAIVLLARWLRCKGWSGLLGELSFVPRQCLLLSRRRLSGEWPLFRINHQHGTCSSSSSLRRDKYSRRALCGIHIDIKERYIEADVLLKTGVTQPHVQLNGVITVKIILVVYKFPSDIYSYLLFFLFLVQKDTWSNVWLCPGVNNGPIQWWCGNETETTACRDGKDAYFLNYTKGSILGFPPVTSSSSAGTKLLTDIMTTTFFAKPTSESTSALVSSLPKTSTAPSSPTQTHGQSASLPTAIGAGVGVPLGIASLGFLGFLFWKQVGRQRTSRSQALSQALSQAPALGTGDQSATAAVRGQWTELPDIQLPRELGGTGRKELPGS